jgi:hypothetical protein
MCVLLGSSPGLSVRLPLEESAYALSAAYALLITTGTYAHAPQLNVPITAADVVAVAAVLLGIGVFAVDLRALSASRAQCFWVLAWNNLCHLRNLQLIQATREMW